jgi:hypothetical protein
MTDSGCAEAERGFRAAKLPEPLKKLGTSGTIGLSRVKAGISLSCEYWLEMASKQFSVQ